MRRIIETLFLLLALFLLLPPIPSEDWERISLSPLSAMALAAFVASRWIRHQGTPRAAVFIMGEAILFALLIWLMTKAHGLLIM